MRLENNLGNGITGSPVSTTKPGGKEESKAEFILTGSSGLSTTAKVRDWIVALVVITWGGQGIYDRNFAPAKDDSNLAKLVKLFDKNGDGKLSKEEINEARTLMDELGKLRKVNHEMIQVNK